MKSINLIWIPNLAQITSDTIQIYRANNEHIDKIVEKIKEVEDEYIDIPLYMDEYSKENNRVSLLLTIADYIDDEEDVDINQYFILPYGEMVKIKDFNTLVNTAKKF
jgi:hypothetical protein